MSPETIKAVIRALEQDLGNAEDNYYRASSAFKNCTPAQMDAEYGQSGETRQAILDGYQQWRDRAKKALEEFKTNA